MTVLRRPEVLGLCSRRNALVRMPHSRKASKSSVINRGDSLLVLASVWAMNLGCVPLHQVVQRGLLLAVALVADRGVIRRPLRLAANGLRDGLPNW